MQRVLGPCAPGVKFPKKGHFGLAPLHSLHSCPDPSKRVEYCLHRILDFLHRVQNQVKKCKPLGTAVRNHAVRACTLVISTRCGATRGIVREILHLHRDRASIWRLF